MSAVKGGQARRHARLELIENSLWSNLLTRGALTAKGRTRAAASLWLQVVDRLAKSAAQLGLERQTRHVGDPLDAVDRAVARANRGLTR